MKRIVWVLVLAGALLHASHLNNLMSRYKHAPKSQRYRIMNQIKLEIARLNKSRQRSAIQQLRSVSSSVARKDAKRTRKNTRRTRRHTDKRHKKPTRSRRRPSPMDVITGGGSSGTITRSPSVAVPGGHPSPGGGSTSGGGSTPGGGSMPGGGMMPGGGSMPGGGMSPGGIF